ncbi:NAD-dependent epimerase/dehydratase family protein [Paraferrimonas sedimenticola]|uniref:Epimerase n=1 Tax=Paraferrimonas sedimenticola TaxID=375674 RepID=A0AA37RUQ7_9GAMM|nr:NAD-dependent epimerase/dehydratase family protein [Paraferrimonas sedimenticola]GLP95483.1 epimerase [Paraferrimonas sedimenticola]
MRVLITGASGMVGHGVLLECLDSQAISQVLLVNRKPLAISHPKLEQLTLSDFTDFTSLQSQLNNLDAVFHCMGVSSMGLSEAEFHKLTFDITQSLADAVHAVSPQAVVTYVSGEGTDSSESGSSMWARVKGKTENYLLNKGFKDVYLFRANAIIPERGVKSKTTWVNWVYWLTRPLFPLMRRRDSITTSRRLGHAMIQAVLQPQPLKHLENRDINALARSYRG